MLPSEEAAAYRACSDAERTAARERLASAVRAFALRAMRAAAAGHGTSVDDLDDRVQMLTVRIVELVMDRRLVAGGEDAYISRAARNAVVDAVRARQSPRRQTHSLDDPGLQHVLADDPHATHAEGMLTAARLAQLSDILARAPAAYRQVLVGRYLEGQPVEVLVLRELQVRGAPVDDPGERSRAENTIHQRISRARRWVQAELAKMEDDGDT